MENAHLMLFLCLAAPLSMMLFVLKDRARKSLGFLLAGVFMCLLAGEINGLILEKTELSERFLTVNVTPLVEEILKALPVVFAAFLYRPSKKDLTGYAIAMGVGFATMENAALMFDLGTQLSAGTLIARGLGAGMMHGVSTLAVGYSMTFVSSDRKLTFAGTVAALSAAIIYHSIYNIMVLSEYPVLGVLLPTVTFVPLLLFLNRK